MSIAEKLTLIAENQQKVYDAGKTAEWNEFWDKFQINGKRSYYNYAFRGYGWGGDNFYPKYDLIVKGDATQMFYAWADYNTELFNLKARLQERDVTLDTSGANRIRQMFSITNFTHIPALDFTNCSGQAQTYHQNVFNGSKKLKTIDSITVNEGNYFDGWFSNCSSLVDITFVGTIGKSISFQYSPLLTADSLTSIITALANYKGTDNEGVYQITLNATSIALLDEQEVTIGGVAWQDYVDNKGWSLA